MFKVYTTIDAVASMIIAGGFAALSYAVALRMGADASAITLVEVLGVLFNFACVWSTARQNPWAWVFGAVGTIFLGILFFNIKLYSSMVMSIFYYLPIQFFGLWCWLKGGTDGEGAKVSRISSSEFRAMLAIVPLATLVWGALLSGYTDAAYVYLDAAVFGCSIAAQYLLTNKRLESWAIWMAVNVMSVYLYWKTGATVLAIQYALFFIHACYGELLWWRDYRKQSAIPATA